MSLGFSLASADEYIEPEYNDNWFSPVSTSGTTPVSNADPRYIEPEDYNGSEAVSVELSPVDNYTYFESEPSRWSEKV